MASEIRPSVDSRPRLINPRPVRHPEDWTMAHPGAWDTVSRKLISHNCRARAETRYLTWPSSGTPVGVVFEALPARYSGIVRNASCQKRDSSSASPKPFQSHSALLRPSPISSGALDGNRRKRIAKRLGSPLGLTRSVGWTHTRPRRGIKAKFIAERLGEKV